MLAIKLWKYAKGYVIIEIEGLTLERVLNLALINNIYLWDVKRISNLQVQVSLNFGALKDLEKLVKRLGCNTRIVEKIGFPFLFYRIKKRKMLGLGLIVSICLVLLLSSIIWEIEIQGSEQIPREEIIKELKKNDIKLGKFKKSINEDIVHNIILKKFDYISFLDVRINGIKLIVNLKEQPIPIEKIDKSYPAHLVAKKKGVITKLVVKEGRALVEKRQIVGEGQLLISGFMENEISQDGYLVHAEGEVFAQTRYTTTVELPIVKTIKNETGRVYRQRGIKIKDNGIKFLNGEVPFEDYIEEVEEKKLINLKWPKIDIPLSSIKYEYREVRIEEVRREIDFLKRTAQVEGIEKINEELSKDSDIVSKNTIYTINDNTLKAKIIIDTIEDITKVEIISN